MRSVIVLSGALLGIATAPAAFAADPAVPAIEQVEALCPGVSGNPLEFGTAKADVPQTALLEAKERALAAGFEEIDPLYTAWSDRLVGADYSLDVPSGDPLDTWGEQFREVAETAGWETTEDGSMAFAALAFAKEFSTAAGSRYHLLEIDFYGQRRGITLRCSDFAMQAEAESERNGILAQGSQRPVAPPPMPPLDDFLARLDCTDPALLAMFAEVEELDDAGALVMARLGPPEGIHGEAEYNRRLVTWLRWRLLASEEIDEEAIWAIEERIATEEPVNHMAELVEMMGAVGGVFEAQEKQDSAALCASYRKAIVVMAEQSVLDARRDAALAAALEAEAVRRGIVLD